jgi:hypothetical protein
VACLPAVTRTVVRRRRTAPGAPPERLWDELIASAGDLGIAVPASRSPRATALQLLDGSPASPQAKAAIDRLTAAVEHDRYGPPGTPAPQATDRADLRLLRRELAAGLERGQRIRALLMPPTVLAGGSAWVQERTGRLLDVVIAGTGIPGRRISAALRRRGIVRRSLS